MIIVKEPDATERIGDATAIHPVNEAISKEKIISSKGTVNKENTQPAPLLEEKSKAKFSHHF